MAYGPWKSATKLSIVPRGGVPLSYLLPWKIRHPAPESCHLFSTVHGDGQANPVHVIPPVLVTSLCVRRSAPSLTTQINSRWPPHFQMADVCPAKFHHTSPGAQLRAPRWPGLPPCWPGLPPCWPAEGHIDAPFFCSYQMLPAALSPPSDATLCRLLRWFNKEKGAFTPHKSP